jgi:phosphoribosyl 1,2-cyclic phosphate phosphodiesterase
MKFKYLGTAAAEGWPALFCHCPACEKARAAGGRNIRTRSQAIIDDKLLIDFPADTYMHVLYLGLDLANVTTCIVTHDHSDHFYPADFEMRRQGFAYFTLESLLTVYGTQPAGTKIQGIIDRYDLTQQGRVAFQLVTPYKPFTADGYTITPLKADHDPRCDPVIYLVSDGSKTILYANDTGYFLPETWDYLEQQRPYLDFISLDCTTGIQPCRNNHMSLETTVEVKRRLEQIGCVDTHTVCCVNHFSHNGKATYDEMVPLAMQQGFLVSYDGMEIEL